MNKIITYLLFLVFFVSTANATNYYVDPTNGLDTNDGLVWETAVKTIGQAQALATANPGIDNVYIKGGGSDITTTTVWTLTSVTENFYGSFEGWESSPDQRPMNDNDGNGIIEPWEFKYPTNYKATYGNTAINGSAYILDGFTITHIGSRTSAMATISSPIGGTIQNCVFTGCNLIFSNIAADIGGCLVKTLGTFKNNLIEKNTVAVNETADIKASILEVNSPGTGTVPTVLITGCVFRNNSVSVTWSGATAAPTKLHFIINVSASALATSVTTSNCLIHNNEASYTGSASFPNSPNSGLVGSTNGSGSYTSDSYINCLFANNKLTNSGTCMYVKSNTYVTHKVYNTVFWNNQNNGTAVSMASSAKQSASSVISNNYMDVATTGIWVGNSGFMYSGNQIDLNTANTGTNAPNFTNPTTVIGNTNDGTVTTSVWCITSDSYLKSNGIATTTTKDKADVTFATNPSVGAYEYVHFRSNATGIWNSGSTWQTSPDNSTWSSTLSNPSRTYAASVNISNGSLVTITDNATAPALTINGGGKLTINNGKTLNTTSLSMGSDITNGTGTFVDENTVSGLTVSGITNVEQYLNAEHPRNWYLSSPVTSATVPASGYSYWKRNEGANNWLTLSSGTELTPGMGFIMNPATSPANYTFTGGQLNSGNVPVTLKYSEGITKAGFNLVGNPYASHVTISKAMTDAANALNTIWYRTVSSYDDVLSKYNYVFQTCVINQDGTYVGTPSGTSPVVAPMQSFWLKTAVNNSVFTFTNSIRSHQASNPMKVKSVNMHPMSILRLQISNNKVFDETVLYTNANASNSYDSYDAPKMSNSSATIPEIYTAFNDKVLAINGFNRFLVGTEIPIGFTVGEKNSYSIKATESTNIGMKIILRDNILNNETDISFGESYNFVSDSGSFMNRFSILFKSPDLSMAVNNTGKDDKDNYVFITNNGQIGIYSKIASEQYVKALVYNVRGQKIAEQVLNSSYSSVAVPEAGIYMIQISTSDYTDNYKILYSTND